MLCASGVQLSIAFSLMISHFKSTSTYNTHFSCVFRFFRLWFGDYYMQRHGFMHYASEFEGMTLHRYVTLQYMRQNDRTIENFSLNWILVSLEQKKKCNTRIYNNNKAILKNDSCIYCVRLVRNARVTQSSALQESYTIAH